MKSLSYKKLIIIITLFGLASCNDRTELTQTDEKLYDIIEANKLTGNPFSEPTPSINSPAAQLGKQLFYSKALSGGKDVACASCHRPALGGGDNLSLSIGVDATVPELIGPGRAHDSNAEHFDGGPTVPRNAPTTFNVAAWKKFMFHDGRVENIPNQGIRTPDSDFNTIDVNAGVNLVHAQARFPVTSPEEMKGFKHIKLDNQAIRNFLAKRLGGTGDADDNVPYPDYWLDTFRIALNKPHGTINELMTEQNIFFFIAEYQRSQNFINSPWNDYINGSSTALSAEAKEGALLFFNSLSKGGADCASCHTGDFFTDEGFHNIGMPQIGRGKGNGDGSEDFGRFRESKKVADKYAFRTPTLLNVAETGPYGHSGAYTSLKAIIKHHLNPQKALDEYDYNQLSQPGIQNLGKLNINTQKALNADSFKLQPLALSETQVDYMVKFMESLTDPCVTDKDCLAPWLLDKEKDIDPNGNALFPISQ